MHVEVRIIGSVVDMRLPSRVMNGVARPAQIVYSLVLTYYHVDCYLQ
jgi:hypothetical protein